LFRKKHLFAHLKLIFLLNNLCQHQCDDSEMIVTVSKYGAKGLLKMTKDEVFSLHRLKTLIHRINVVNFVNLLTTWILRGLALDVLLSDRKLNPMNTILLRIELVPAPKEEEHRVLLPTYWLCLVLILTLIFTLQSKNESVLPSPSCIKIHLFVTFFILLFTD